MSVRFSLLCPGPDGSNNGCPESVRPVDAETEANHEAIKQAWGGLLARALTGDYIRCAWDQKIRCRACAARGPGTIAGIDQRYWEKALARFEAGAPPSHWGGQDGLPTARQWNNAVHRVEWLAERVRAAPARKPRKRRAPVLPDARWTEVLERFRAGEDKEAICTGRNGWPTAKQWNGRMERLADFREAVNAEWTRRRQEAEAAIDAILLRFEAGEILRDLLDGPLRNRWFARLGSDPAFRERVMAQHARRHHSSYSREHRDALMAAALKFVASGGQPSKLTGVPDTLGSAALHRLVATSPEFAAAYEAALEAGGGRRGARAIYDRALDWDAAFDAFGDGQSIEVACDAPGRPSPAQWFHRQRNDAGFRSRVEVERKRLRKAAEIRRDARQTERQRQREAERTERAIPLGERFRTALTQNEIYAAINRAVPLRLPAHVRDDVLGEMVLAVLEGALDLDAVQAKAREYLRRYDRASERWKLISLDAPIAGTDDLRLIDTLSTEEGLW